MTIRARVELIESFTHDSRWRKFRRGSPQIITNPAEIQYYKNQPGFSVVLLDPETKEKVVKEVIKKVKSKSQQDEVEKEEEGYDEEEYDEEEEDEEEAGYTEGMLKDFKKSQLRSLANDLELDIEGTKKELIARIIDATNQ
jgi:cell division ATPase FtsA